MPNKPKLIADVVLPLTEEQVQILKQHSITLIAKASPSSSTTSGPAGELRGFLRKHNSGARLEIDSDLTPTPPKKRKPIGYESDRGGHTRMRVQGESSQDAGKSKKMSGNLEVEIKGQSYALNKVPDEDSAIVLAEKDKLLESIDLQTLADDLGRVGGFIRIAYNGVGAAGPKFTNEQIEIQRRGYDITKLCDKSALTVAKFKKASSCILTDLQTTYNFLLDNMEELAIDTLSAVSKLAGDMQQAALELQHEALARMTSFTSKIKQCQTEENMAECAVDALQEAIGALKQLSAVMMQAALFWQQMQDHCKSLADSGMKKTVEQALKYSEEKRLKVWTSNGFKRKAIEFYAGWVALHGVCSVYKEQIKLTQKDLYRYIAENPSYEESRSNLKELAEKFLVDLKRDQQALSDKNFTAQEEIEALNENKDT